jgi:hypothetical protein
VVGRDDPIPPSGDSLLHRPFFDHLEDPVGADRFDELVGLGSASLVLAVAFLLSRAQLVERAAEEAEVTISFSSATLRIA